MTELPPILNNVEALKDVLDQLPQGIMIFQDYSMIYTNPAEARMLGYDVSELIGLSFEDTFKMIHPDDLEKLRNAAFNMQERNEATRHDRVRLVRKDGTIIPIDNYGRTISIQDEKVIAVIT
ncbi:MAG: PAS domain-containing protein, partial [Candidatus Thorarchaeota archaeon]